MGGPAANKQTRPPIFQTPHDGPQVMMWEVQLDQTSASYGNERSPEMCFQCLDVKALLCEFEAWRTYRADVLGGTVFHST